MTNKKTNIKVVEMECHRCKHNWLFGGGNLGHLGKYPVYAQCPKCRTSVKVQEGKMEENKKE